MQREVQFKKRVMKVLVLNGLVIVFYFLAIIFFPDKNDVESTGAPIIITANVGGSVGVKPCENVPDDGLTALVEDCVMLSGIEMRR